MESGLIGRNIRILRRDKGMSQAQLAEKANMSRAGIQKIEQGKAQPRTQTLRLIGEALEVSLFELVAESPQLDQVRFRYSTNDHSSPIVYGCLRDTTNTMTSCQIGKFHRFDHLSFDHWAFQGHLMSEHHGPRAIRSGRGDIDLQ